MSFIRQDCGGISSWDLTLAITEATATKSLKRGAVLRVAWPQEFSSFWDIDGPTWIQPINQVFVCLWCLTWLPFRNQTCQYKIHKLSKFEMPGRADGDSPGSTLDYCTVKKVNKQTIVQIRKLQQTRVSWWFTLTTPGFCWCPSAIDMIWWFLRWRMQILGRKGPVNFVNLQQWQCVRQHQRSQKWL